MRSFLFILLLANAVSANADEVKLKAWFNKVDAFLGRYVDHGMVDYKAIRNNPMELMQLINTIEDADITKYDNQTQKAFWINAYNILVISGIITEYPVSSPLDIEGFFKANKHKAAGEWLTLDAIEQKKLMDVYEDARLHFVLVCAAKGCPKLADEAYRPEKLDEQLDERTRLAMNDEQFIWFDEERAALMLSELFRWYEADFGKTGEDMLAFINQYREEPFPAGSFMDTYEYDWSLNEKKK